VRGLFVTGTDTDVGKTTVARGLLRRALRNGRRVVPFKPAESGVAHGIPSDADLLWEAAGRPVPRDQVSLWRFAAPLAPAVAAAESGATLALDAAVARAEQLAGDGSPLLVEGAGGLLVPYGPGWTAADLAGRLALPVLVVARAALGTINHTALTVAELRRRQVPIAGIVLVETSAVVTPDRATNPAQIAHLTGIAPAGTLPFLPGAADDDLAAAVSRLALCLPPTAGPWE
jgi:dethiobiotin synthetase